MQPNKALIDDKYNVETIWTSVFTKKRQTALTLGEIQHVKYKVFFLVERTLNNHGFIYNKCWAGQWYY